MLSCGLDNTIYKWDLETGIREVFHELASPPKSIAISGNDQNIAVGTGEGKLLVFSGRSDQPLELSNETGNPILSLAFRNDRNTLISADQKGWIKNLGGRSQRPGLEKKTAPGKDQ